MAAFVGLERWAIQENVCGLVVEIHRLHAVAGATCGEQTLSTTSPRLLELQPAPPVLQQLRHRHHLHQVLRAAETLQWLSS